MIKLILILFFLIPIFLFSQDLPDTLWTRTFGGVQNEVAASVYPTSDGGYIIAGYTSSFGAGETDFWLIKTDENGYLEWDQTYGGWNWDKCRSVMQTSDGGYILLGQTSSYGAGAADFWLIKTDSFGNEEWNQTFGGSEQEQAYSVQQTTDGGYILTGFTESYGTANTSLWLIKTNSFGQLEWDQIFGFSFFNIGYSVQQTSDGGYVVGGWGILSMWLIKTDENGNLEWEQFFNLPGGDSRCFSVKQTLDGGYIMTGRISFYSSDHDIWLVKTDSLGNEEWNQLFGGNEHEFPFVVRQTPDGGYIITGFKESYFAGLQDIWLIKTFANGNLDWDITFGGLYTNEAAYSMELISDREYIIAGRIGILDPYSNDFWLLKVGYESAAVDNKNIYPSNLKLDNYPNPFNPSTTISFSIPEESKVELSVYNIKGQKIKPLLSNQIAAGEHSVVWNGKDASGKKVSSGIYLYELNINGKTEAVKKCLLLK